MTAEVTTMEIAGITINAFWDEDARVFVATSTDLPSLVLEAETIPEIAEEAELVVPELLKLSGIEPPSGTDEISIGIISSTITKVAV